MRDDDDGHAVARQDHGRHLAVEDSPSEATQSCIGGIRSPCAHRHGHCIARRFGVRRLLRLEAVDRPIRRKFLEFVVQECTVG